MLVPIVCTKGRGIKPSSVTIKQAMTMWRARCMKFHVSSAVLCSVRMTWSTLPFVGGKSCVSLLDVSPEIETVLERLLFVSTAYTDTVYGMFFLQRMDDAVIPR